VLENDLNQQRKHDFQSMSMAFQLCLKYFELICLFELKNEEYK